MKSNELFTKYLRRCKYCGKIIHTTHRKGVVCDKCKLKGKSGKIWMNRTQFKRKWLGTIIIV